VGAALAATVTPRLYHSLAQEPLQIVRQRCCEVQIVTAVIGKDYRLRVQEQAF